MIERLHYQRQRDIYDVLGLFRLPLVLLILVGTVGVLGFMHIEGYPFPDAVYQTIITLSTVGFTEALPFTV